MGGLLLCRQLVWPSGGRRWAGGVSPLSPGAWGGVAGSALSLPGRRLGAGTRGWAPSLCSLVPGPVPGLPRRRLVPAPLPDATALGRKPSLPGQWVDLPPPLAGSLQEPFEIKVYEIDDVERLQRHRPPPRADPAEVRGGGALGGGRALGAAGRLPDPTFHSCPQPSQDVEKVGTVLAQP